MEVIVVNYENLAFLIALFGFALCFGIGFAAGWVGREHKEQERAKKRPF